MVPYLTTATVTAQDPDRYRVYVLLDGPFLGQGPTIAVGVGTHGPRDALRGRFHELPSKGTRGIVAFPRLDPRNGVWIASTEGPENDAGAGQPGALPSHYEAAWSGFWTYRDGQGIETTVWPDGTTLTVGATGVPNLTRHVVASGQQRQAQAFTQAQRVSGSVSPRPLRLHHPSGMDLSVAADGTVTLVAGSGQVVNITANTVNVGASGETLQTVCLKAFYDWVTGHTHSNVQNGGGTSGPPVGSPPGNALTTSLHAG